MLLDGRKLPQGEIINTQVCIVGAGPAGITLAKEFIDQNFRVCLLESGDLKFNSENAALGQGETAGDPFPPLQDMRPRQYGGQSNLWYIEIAKNRTGLRHAPLDKIDFEKRDWLPYSGWPFDKDHLNPFYERAQAFCKLGPFAYEAEAWESTQAPQTHFDGDRLTTSVFQFGPRDIFTNEYRKQIEKSTNIDTILNANAVEIETDETEQTAKCVRVACLNGNKFSVAAKVIILACGGLENPRLLLLSNRVNNKGLGNQHDLVGRFYIDHPLVRCGMLVPQNRNVFNRMGLYDLLPRNGVAVMGKYTLTEEIMRRDKLFSMTAMLFPKDDLPPINTGLRSDATVSAKALFSSARHGRLPKNFLGHFKNVITGVDDIVSDLYTYKFNRDALPSDLGRGGWSLRKGNEERYTKFEVLSQTEQTPHPDNRVTLSSQSDPLGIPQVKLTNRWSELDISSVKRSQQIFAEEFARAGLGQLQIERDGDRPMAVSLSTHHNMGTTRMHDDPKQGVVNANCLVHGTANLFIAGSSVFPTGGYANPTLTIVAISIRLADHIKAKLLQ